MKKRIVSLLLTGVLAVSMIAGCGAQKDAQGGGGYRQGGFDRGLGLLQGRRSLRALLQALRPAPGNYMKPLAPAPTFWALRPKPRVTFPSRGKSPKARQGLPPLDPASTGNPPSLVLR